MKKCNHCHEIKDYSQFNRQSTTSDGFHRTCRACAKAINARRYRERTESIKQRTKQWAQENPERVREIRRQNMYLRYHADPDAARAYQQAWREANSERLRKRAMELWDPERLRRWRRDNPEKRRAQELRRRARKLLAAGDASAGQIADRIAYYGNLCWMCGDPADTIDHVIPLAAGGTNWPANLRPACRPCNSRKGARRVAA